MEKSYAKIAESLARKEDKYQKILDNAPTNRDKQTAELMIERIGSRREQLMADNSSDAGEIETPVMAKGGKVPSYEGGGRLPEQVLSVLQSADAHPLDLTRFMGPAEGISTVPLKAKAPGFLDRLLGNSDQIIDGVVGGAGAVAPFIDNLAFSKYLKSVVADPTPNLYNAPAINTDVDVNPELADAKRGQRILNRSLDRSNTSRGAANNAKIAGFVNRMNNTGRVRAQERNQENRLKNRASMIEANINNRNTDIANDFKQRNTDFINQRNYNKYLNTLNLSEDIGNINTQRLNRRFQEDTLDVLRPLYNRFGLLDKYFSNY